MPEARLVPSTLHRNYVAFETIALKEIRRFARIWVQTILPPAVSMGLYLVIFGKTRRWPPTRS